ncbi:hypothetical protein N9185_01195, partial [bacterium]|nr:hypothetical protein [bacterium]
EYGVVATIAHNSALVALVPHPREHQWTYFGVLAPASPLWGVRSRSNYRAPLRCCALAWAGHRPSL